MVLDGLNICIVFVVDFVNYWLCRLVLISSGLNNRCIMLNGNLCLRLEVCVARIWNFVVVVARCATDSNRSPLTFVGFLISVKADLFVRVVRIRLLSKFNL